MSNDVDPGTVLIVGATGELGSRIAQRLLDRRVEVRALVREGSNTEDLEAMGAKLVQGDLRDASSLHDALEGADRVLTTANAPGGRESDTIQQVDMAGNENLVEASEAAGVDQLVFTSAWLADPEDPNPFFRAKALTEQRIRESDVSGTILAPNIFMEGSLPGIVLEPALEQGEVVLVGEGDRKHSWVSIEDVATLGANVLGRRQARGRRLRFGGPEAVSWRDIVRTAQDVLEVDIDVRTVEQGEPVPGLNEFETGVLAGTDQFDSPDTTDEIANTFGVDRTRIREYIEAWADKHA